MKKIIFSLILVFVIVGAIYFLFMRGSEPGERDILSKKQEQELSGALQKVFLNLSFDEENRQQAELDFEEGMTAFDVLEAGSQILGLNLEAKQYDLGVFVEAIGEKKNGQDDKYWIYYINDESAPVAADQLQVEPEDRIDWRFEKSPF